MFKKKIRPDDRRNDLQARLTAAESKLEKLRADAVAVASSDPNKLAPLSESAARLEFEICAYTKALKLIEEEEAERQEIARREADRLQREETSRNIFALADALEKASAPIPDALQTFRDAIAAAMPVIGPNGLADLLGNLHVELPAAAELFVSELRARADQTLQGTAPPTLPSAPILTAIEETAAPPTISVFSLESLSWLEHGQRAGCGAFQIVALPVATANIAMTRGLAILPDSDRSATLEH